MLHAGRVAQKEHVQQITSRAQAAAIVESNARRIYDWKWRVGQLPDGNMFNLGGRPIEGACLQAGLPLLDIQAIPLSPASVSSDSDVTGSVFKSCDKFRT